MKLIVAGSRTIDPKTAVAYIEAAAIQWEFEPLVSEIVSGRSPFPSVDAAGEIWAASHEIPVTPFPADWQTLGKAAPSIRNREMAVYADALLLIWTGRSEGNSQNMLDEMKALRKSVFEVIVRRHG